MNDNPFNQTELLTGVSRAYAEAAASIHSTAMADITDTSAQTVQVLEGIFDMLYQIALQLEAINDRAGS